MIIHSHKKHISLQILHWMHNDVVVQSSFTRVCQGVPNKMLGANYTNRDVSSFQTRDLSCNGRNKYVQLSHLLFVGKCLDDMSYWTNLYHTVADNQLHFFTISNLNYTVFVSLALTMVKTDLVFLFLFLPVNASINVRVMWYFSKKKHSRSKKKAR